MSYIIRYGPLIGRPQFRNIYITYASLFSELSTQDRGMGKRHYPRKAQKKAARKRRKLTLKVKREPQGDWRRASTPTPDPLPETDPASRSPATGEPLDRKPLPWVSPPTSPSSGREGSSDHPTTSLIAPGNGPVGSKQSPREAHLAKLVICTTFARLVTNSGSKLLHELAIKMLRQKITSPMEAVLALSLYDTPAVQPQ